MDERRRNIVVGLTTVAGVIGLVALLMLFGYLPGFLERGYLIRVELPRAAGIHPDSRVRYSGIDIGSVESVRLQEPPETGVVVTARINPGVRIPRQARASVVSQLLGGGASLDFSLVEPLPPDAQYLPTDNTAIVDGDIPDLASTLAQELRDALEEPVANLERVSTQFEQLSREWTQVGANVNRLLEARDPAAVDAGEMAGNVATIVARLDQRLAELRTVLAGVNAYVADEQLRDDIRQTAANAREITASVDQNLETLVEHYVAVADDLSQTLAMMRATVEQARQPDGTLGKLLADPQLYNNLNDAAQRLQQAIDEARLLVEKWKSEGLPVQF